ncbi:hemolysin XhlA [Cohnella zeiphila]|uniref:Hemolysin XhlA n=1 Tax=Cohnella zeiphila TaxID=2761120 RepID=A0A7X0SHI0_9BACL|nr:hemolysin XhlA [Cohnella zeiphila]MBB6730069.1 hemolysin XhlA [Cohnella zeiphila]
MPEETNEILQRLTRVETKLDLMNSAREIAQEGLLSAKEAHHRLDELREELVGYKQTTKWLVGTTISLAGVTLSALGLMIKAVNG